MTPVESAIHDFVREHAEAETRFLAEIVKVPSDNPPGIAIAPQKSSRRSWKDLAFRSSGARFPRTLSRPTA